MPVAFCFDVAAVDLILFGSYSRIYLFLIVAAFFVFDNPERISEVAEHCGEETSDDHGCAQEGNVYHQQFPNLQSYFHKHITSLSLRATRDIYSPLQMRTQSSRIPCILSSPYTCRSCLLSTHKKRQVRRWEARASASYCKTAEGEAFSLLLFACRSKRQIFITRRRFARNIFMRGFCGTCGSILLSEKLYRERHHLRDISFCAFVVIPRARF